EEEEISREYLFLIFALRSRNIVGSRLIFENFVHLVLKIVQRRLGLIYRGILLSKSNVRLTSATQHGQSEANLAHGHRIRELTAGTFKWDCDLVKIHGPPAPPCSPFYRD